MGDKLSICFQSTLLSVLTARKSLSTTRHYCGFFRKVRQPFAASCIDIETPIATHELLIKSRSGGCNFQEGSVTHSRPTVIRATSVRTPFVVGGVMVGVGSCWVFTCGLDTSLCGNGFLTVKKKNQIQKIRVYYKKSAFAHMLF